MINVVHDLNLLFHRWAHYLAYKNNGFLYKKQDKAELIQNVMYSLYTDTNKYKSYLDRVIICADSRDKSWRSFVNIGDQVQYKLVRSEREIKFDRDVLHECINELCDILQSKGIIVLRHRNTEADDLIAISVGLLFSNNESSVIVTSDSDIRQLVRTVDDKFIYVYDSDREKKHHYIDKKITTESDGLISRIQDVNNDLDFGGIFNMGDNELIEKPTKEGLLNMIYQDSSVINPFGIIFSKMLGGDKGDGVPSCLYYRKVKKDGTLYQNEVSFTHEKANVVHAILSQSIKDVNTYGFFRAVHKSEELRNFIANHVINEAGIPKDDSLVRKVSDNILRNITMVFLNTAVYEENFKKELVNYVRSGIMDTSVMEAHKNAIADGFRYELLDGTQYAMGSDNAKDYDDKSIRY